MRSKRRDFGGEAGADERLLDDRGFGVDSRNLSVGKGNNSDVNILCNIDQGTGEIRLVSVYRDSYLNISDKNTYNKINAAYMQGGPNRLSRRSIGTWISILTIMRL